VVLCHGGGRFLVVYVGTNYSVAHASVFSSQTRAWTSVASFHHPQPNLEIARSQPKALVGNVVYYKFQKKTQMLKSARMLCVIPSIPLWTIGCEGDVPDPARAPATASDNFPPDPDRTPPGSMLFYTDDPEACPDSFPYAYRLGLGPVPHFSSLSGDLARVW
jgi:hypothetical protein